MPTLAIVVIAAVLAPVASAECKYKCTYYANGDVECTSVTKGSLADCDVVSNCMYVWENGSWNLNCASDCEGTECYDV